MTAFVFLFIAVVLLVVGIIFVTKSRRDLRDLVVQTRVELSTMQPGSAQLEERRRLEKEIDADVNFGRTLTLMLRLAYGGLSICLIWLVLLCVTIIPTRNMGVTVAFGKPTGTIGNGFHLIAPWETVETYDASILTLKLDGEPGEDTTPAPTVRLSNAATAKVDVTVQWQIDPTADITQLHLDYRNFDNIQDNVVRRQLNVALNAVFEAYDPLVALKGGAQQVTLAQLGTQVQERLSGLMPKGIIVRSVAVPLIRFDPKVQAALDSYQQVLNDTRLAEQQKITAQAQKEALDILSATKMSPEAFAQQCLIVTERLAQQGKALPPAWSCVAASVSTVPVR
jgi:SPFH domain/Band 7 family protein